MEGAFKMSTVEARLRGRQYVMEAMKEPTSTAYQVAGTMDLRLRQHDEAIALIEKSLALDPNDPACHYAMSWALSFSGRPAEGMKYAKSYMRLGPHNLGGYLGLMGVAHFCLGEWQEAVTAMEEVLKLNPGLPAPAEVLASAYAHLGRDDEAKATAQTFRRGSPVPYMPPRQHMFFWPFKDRGVADSFVEGLKKAHLLDAGPEYVHVSREDQLTGDNLKAFFFPSTIAGFGSDGSPWSFETTKDGKMIPRSPAVPGGVVDTGKRWIEGDKVWTQYRSQYSGMPICSTVFRNQKGTPEGKDEYFSFSDITMIPFSRVK